MMLFMLGEPQKSFSAEAELHFHLDQAEGHLEHRFEPDSLTSIPHSYAETVRGRVVWPYSEKWGNWKCKPNEENLYILPQLKCIQMAVLSISNH